MVRPRAPVKRDKLRIRRCVGVPRAERAVVARFSGGYRTVPLERSGRQTCRPSHRGRDRTIATNEEAAASNGWSLFIDLLANGRERERKREDDKTRAIREESADE